MSNEWVIEFLLIDKTIDVERRLIDQERKLFSEPRAALKYLLNTAGY